VASGRAIEATGSLGVGAGWKKQGVLLCRFASAERLGWSDVLAAVRQRVSCEA
jgi:hypothetical protein